MLDLNTIVTFFAASVLLALVPGPDNVFVLAQSALHGRRAGLWVTLGLCTGLICHTTAVALGLAALFQTSATAFLVFKIFGVAYLLFLAWQSFRAKPADLTVTSHISPTTSALYVRGVIMNVSNPKVSLFFLAFLPQFTDPARGTVTLQIILLGALFILSTLLVFGGIAMLAGTLAKWIKRSGHTQVMLNRLAGIIFASLAVKLAMVMR